MERCKLLAFLLCEKATAGPDGKVTLHGLFDRIIVPATPAKPKLFFVFYKVVVKEPCTLSLRVLDPFKGEISGNWRDSLAQIGPMQATWALTSSLFKQPGPYVLELKQETDDSEALSLATMLFVVEQESE
jgi:hypothetical protein